MLQQRLNIYPNTPPHDFSLRTKDIEGARSKHIERRELMERLKAGDQNIMFSQGAYNKLNQNQEVQQLRSDYNYLKQQVDQLNSTIKATPMIGNQNGEQQRFNYQQINAHNYNPNRYSGNSDQKINIYRNAGNQVINNQSNVFSRNQSLGHIPSNIQPIYEKLLNQFFKNNSRNQVRLGSQEMLNRIPSQNGGYNQNIRSENNLNGPRGLTQRLSPQQQQGFNPNFEQSNYLQNGYNDNQFRGSSIQQMNTFLNKYERHRYVPPQKNEFSRFPSKQVIFY